jgi:aminoglycoside phosphotransferase (APT) family kinase protein
MIPEEKKMAVTRALREAFGVSEFEDIRMLNKGHSSVVFRIVVRRSPFLLRIVTRPHTHVGPARQFICMSAAAEAGLAPRVWYASVEEQLCITDFVEEAPFPASEARVRMPAMLRALHALPPFPALTNPAFDTTCMFLLHRGPAVDQFFRSFQAANILPKSESDELIAWHAQLAAVYPHHDPDMVSSHNDLFKPDNILFDGRRPWLVDWEAAFLNDRYADLAVFANLVVTNDEEERAYLREYFGHPPDDYQMARFFLMQQLAHIFYAMAFLLIGSSGKPVDQNENVPEFSDFHRRIWARELSLTDNQAKTAFGRVHWEQLSQNMRQPRFQERFNETLRIVSDRHAPLSSSGWRITNSANS